MKVVLTTAARDDPEAIADHIARDNPARGRSFVAELIGKARALGDLPEGFPLVPRYAHLGIRRRVHRNYPALYRVEANRISVIHILHGARDYEDLLFAD